MAHQRSSGSLRPSWTARGLAISAFLAATSVADARVLARQIDPSQLLSNYDYVIIGGGTSGLTVADRLTEDPAVSVLVLEAGGWGNTSAIEHVNFKTKTNTQKITWPGLYSVPQVNLGNAVKEITVGKVVGGGSAANGMYNLRGSSSDYDRWDQLFEMDGHGSKAGWGWDGILPFFKKVSVIV